MQPAILGIIWARLPSCSLGIDCGKHVAFLYATCACLAFLVLGTIFAVDWVSRHLRKREVSIKGDPLSETKQNLLKLRLASDKTRLTEALNKLDQLSAANFRLKADYAKAQSTIDDLSQKHLASLSQNRVLATQMEEAASRLSTTERESSEYQRRIREARAVFVSFVEWVRLTCKRKRVLSTQLQEAYSELAELLVAFVNLRRRYLGLKDICGSLKEKVVTLRKDLEDEQLAHSETKSHRERVLGQLHGLNLMCIDHQVEYNALVDCHTVVHEELAHLHTAHDSLKEGCGGLRKDLKEAFQLVQATQDLAQISLSNMSDPKGVRSLTIKQDFMKIGHLLDLVRLNASDIVGNLGILVGCDGDEFEPSVIQPQPAPGSVDNSMCRLRAIYGIPREAGDDGLENSEPTSSHASSDNPTAIKRMLECAIEGAMNDSFVSDISIVSDVSDQTKVQLEDSICGEIGR